LRHEEDRSGGEQNTEQAADQRDSNGFA